MAEHNKVFWHEAFFEALKLEFHHYQDLLIFDNEYQLSKEALIMDVLIIKKKPGQQINKNIGKIFRSHNIVEYKSETDTITEHDYNKVVAYALLYSSFNKIPVDDITITFAITKHPKALTNYLTTKRGFAVHTAESGIYYVTGDTFTIQILESKLLPQDENLFLRNLRSNLSTDDVTQIAKAYETIKTFEAKNVYINRLIQANQKIFKEATSMSDVVREIFNEVAEREGWFVKRELATSKTIAKKLLLMGRPIEEIVEATDLPYETVIDLV